MRTPNRSPIGDLIRPRKLLNLNHANDSSEESPSELSKLCFRRQPLPMIPQSACIHSEVFAGFAENHRASDFVSSSSMAFSSGMKSIPVTPSITRTGTTNLLRSFIPGSARCGIKNPIATRFPFTRANTTLKKCVGIGVATPFLSAVNSTSVPGGGNACSIAIPHLPKGDALGMFTSMGFLAQDLHTLGNGALKSFDERVKLVHPDICYEFDLEVGRLEAQTIQLYGIAALAAKREPDPQKVAEVWGMMVQICDGVAAKIISLCQKHPACSASHDKILDLRNKCARLMDIHG